MKKIFIVICALLIVFLIYRSRFYKIMYDTYENNSAEYEDENVYLQSRFSPAYDYGSLNILFAHYRNVYYFTIDIKSKTNTIVKAEIIKNELIKNGDSSAFMNSESWTRDKREMVFMEITEIYQSEITMPHERRDEYLETFKKDKTVWFKHKDEEYPQTESYYIRFEIPINYKIDNIVEVNLEVKLTFEDSHEKVIKQSFGGNKQRIIN